MVLLDSDEENEAKHLCKNKQNVQKKYVYITRPPSEWHPLFFLCAIPQPDCFKVINITH